MEHIHSGYRYPLAYVNYDVQEIAAVTKTLQDGRTTCGENVKSFEKLFAQYVGAHHATMVNSGSSADLLVAFGLGEPDERNEIIIPAVTWPTQVWSCITAGYTVRLVDVDPETLQMDTDALARAISPSTRAIFLTHLMGNVGDLDAILKLAGSITIIEDCCESLGAKWNNQHVGTFGQASAFSFFFSHLISTMEGGMVVTNNDDMPYRLLRSHGWQPQPDCRFWFPTWGFNLRPMEVQGAFGVVQMARLEGFRHARTHNAALLESLITAKHSALLSTARVLDQCEPSWHGFPLMVKSDIPGAKDVLCSYLEQHGIETRPVVAGNLARQKAVQDLPIGRIVYDLLPGADLVHDHGFYIGLASFEDNAGVAYVDSVLDSFSLCH